MQTSERTDLQGFIVKKIYKYSKRYLAFTKKWNGILISIWKQTPNSGALSSKCTKYKKCHETKGIK